MKKLKKKKESFTFLYNKFEKTISRKCLLLVYISIHVYCSKKDKVHFDFCRYKDFFFVMLIEDRNNGTMYLQYHLYNLCISSEISFCI